MATTTASQTLANLSEADATALRGSLRGEVIHPDDPEYDTARQLYNTMIDKRPAAIARCVDVADVVACVNFARDRGLLLAVRDGGHNLAGLSSCDGGLVIDLSTMKGIWVDPGRRTVCAQGGCTWGDVDLLPMPSDWPLPATSYRQLGLPVSRWEAVSDI